MKRYEYHCRPKGHCKPDGHPACRSPEQYEQWLNDMGSQGWKHKGAVYFESDECVLLEREIEDPGVIVESLTVGEMQPVQKQWPKDSEFEPRRAGRPRKS